MDGDHPIVPWLVMYAASVINRGREDHEGFNPLRRWKGREFSRPVAELGECGHYSPALQGKTSSTSGRWMESG